MLLRPLLLLIHLLLNGLHHILNLEGGVDGCTHFISVLDAHAQQILHLLELDHLLITDGLILTLLLWLDLVDELDYSARHFLILDSKDRPDHEVFDVCTSTLVVDLLDKLRLFTSVV